VEEQTPLSCAMCS